MKKTLICLAIALSAIFTVAHADWDVAVIIDGEELLTDAAPFIEDGTTLVPMRGIFEKLGAAVDWNGDTKTVTAEKGDTKIVLGIGSNIMKKNEDEVELIRAPLISDDRTFVPLRAVSEAFGADVDWDGGTKTVTITTVKETPAPMVEAAASPEPTPAIPTPQPVSEISDKTLPISADVIPTRHGAFFNIHTRLVGQNEKYEEYGLRISELKSTVYSKDAIKLTAFEEDIRVESNNDFLYYISTAKNGIKLKSNQTYRYGIYMVADGVEYQGEKGVFTTLKETQTYPRLEASVEDIEVDNIVFVGSRDDKLYIKPETENYGIYIGTTEDELEKIECKRSLLNGSGIFSISTDTVYYPNTPYVKWGTYYARCTAKDLGVELKPYTKYFWKFFAVWDDEEYTSDVASFTTDIE